LRSARNNLIEVRFLPYRRLNEQGAVALQAVVDNARTSR
jgi:hypothetical protein